MKKIIIKKYPNRRLYNTQISSYIALNDLFQMVRQGIDFIVIDSKTDEDITRSILTQIIFEQEAKGYNLLPISFLRQIISCYQNQQASILPNYLEAMMDHFSTSQEKMNQIAIENPLKIFEAVGRNNIEIVEKGIKIFYQSFGVKESDD